MGAGKDLLLFLLLFSDPACCPAVLLLFPATAACELLLFTASKLKSSFNFDLIVGPPSALRGSPAPVAANINTNETATKPPNEQNQPFNFERTTARTMGDSS